MSLPEPVAALLRGPLAGRLAPPGPGEPPPGALALQRLVGPGGAAAAVTAWAEQRGYGCDIPAAASLWSKYLFNLVLPPLVLGRVLECPVALRGAVALEGHLPVRWYPAAGAEIAPGADEPVRWMTPFVQGLRDGCGVRTGVLWGNVGNLVTYLLDELPKVLPARAEAIAAHRARWVDAARRRGRRNPLYRSIRYGPEIPPRRVRRVCCLRYRLPDVDYCGTCPLA